MSEHTGIHHQLGAIGARLDNIVEMMKQRSEQADRQAEKADQEMRTLKHDQRNVEQKVEMIGWRQESLEKSVKEVSESLKESVDEVSESLEEIRKPVKSLMEMRTRFAGALIIIGSLGTAAALLWETIVKWLLDHFVGWK